MLLGKLVFEKRGLEIKKRLKGVTGEEKSFPSVNLDADDSGISHVFIG